MGVTLKFLSEKTGLSITAISLILNNKEVRVSDEKRKLVLKMAKKYNYVPNFMALGLVTKKTKTIGLIVPDITNIFFSEIAKHIGQKIQEHGYSLFLFNTNDKLTEERKQVDLLLAKGVDALIICPSIESTDDFEYLENFSKTKKCVIVFDRDFKGNIFHSVISDNLNGSSSAVEYLINKGHRKIGCITGPMNNYSAITRVEGYKKALENANIKINNNLIKNGNYRFKSGYEQGLLLLKEDITAVFVCNDLMAYGFYRAAKEVGKSLPEDISVIGYDDLFFSAMLDTPLTSIGQDEEEMANNICELLFENLQKDLTCKGDKIILETYISERKSVKTI